MRRPGAKETHDSEPQIAERPTVGQPLLAAGEAPVPVADRVERHAESPQRPARPPEVPCPLEDRERAGPGLHGAVKVAGDDAHVRERALGERRILLEPARLRDLERPATVAHRDFRRAAGEAVEVAGPAVPGGAAARIVEGLDQLADLLERLDVLGVTPERELDLRLLDDRVDTPPSVRLGVRQRFEPRESPLE